jgi:CheY-like chemotaxis protein
MLVTENNDNQKSDSASISDIEKFERLFGPQLHQKKLLVIEDDPDIRDLVKVILNYMHYECDLVADAFEASRSITERKYDYLVLDVQLPGLSGISMLRELDKQFSLDPSFNEKSHYFSKIPVVLISGHQKLEPIPGELEHFEIVGFVSKSNLRKGLVENFAC